MRLECRNYVPSHRMLKSMSGILPSARITCSYSKSLRCFRMCRLSSVFNCANCCKFFTWRFFDVNMRRWSSVTNGNCKNVLLYSHRPWMIIGDSFMQFSIVSMLGNFDTKKKKHETKNSLKNQMFRLRVTISKLTSSGIGQHNQLIDTRNHFLDKIRTFHHNCLTILVQCIRIQLNSSKMSMQNGACFHRIHTTQR